MSENKYISENYNDVLNYTNESIFLQSNAYLGIRGYFEEGIPGHENIPEDFTDDIESSPHQYLAGYFDKSPVTGNTMVNLPTLKLFTIYLNGEKLDLANGRIENWRREIDFSKALFRRSYIWTSPSGKKTSFSFNSFLSYQRKHILVHKIEIKALNWEGEVKVKDIADIRGKTIRHHHYSLEEFGDSKDFSYLRIKTKKTSLNAYIGKYLKILNCKNRKVRKTEKNGTQIAKEYTFDIEKAKKISLERYLSVRTDIDTENITPNIESVCRDLSEAASSSWGGLLSEQTQAWEKLWKKAGIKINGDNELNQKMIFSIFQILQSYRPGNSNLSIGAKFLSGDHYAGHYFWDTDMFLFPFFLHTIPNAADDLLKYRIKSLEKAQQKAQNFNCCGAFFPWEGDGLDPGRENCPKWWQDEKAEEPVRVPCGEIELHINAAVAFAAYRYLQENRDNKEKIHKLIIETGRFWASRGIWEEGEYQIKNVIGPDEYHEYVDNNAYTNYMAKWNIGLALKLNSESGDKYLSENEKKEFSKIHKLIKIPYSKELDIIAQDDSFLSLPELDMSEFDNSQPLYCQLTPEEITKYQVVKQADIISLFNNFPFDFDYALMNRCWEYYVSRTLHDSNLSAGPHCIVANQLNKKNEAMKYFKEVINLDAGLAGHNVNEGLHAANSGNVWNCLVNGFGGISFYGEYLFCTPRIPEKWKSLEFSIIHKKRKLYFKISEDAVKISGKKGQSLKMIIEGAKYELPENAFSVDLKRIRKGVIFDLDGVLVDSAECHYHAWKDIADELGIKFDREKNHLLRGVSRRESLMIMIKGQTELTEKQISSLMEQKNKIYRKYLDKAGEKLLLPGVKEKLSFLKMAGLKLAVASSSKNTPALLKQTGLDKYYFDGIADGNDIKESKPDPEVFLLAAERCDLLPENSLVAEDAPAGTEGARRAEMGVWGVGPAELGNCDIRSESLLDTDIMGIFSFFDS